MTAAKTYISERMHVRVAPTLLNDSSTSSNTYRQKSCPFTIVTNQTTNRFDFFVTSVQVKK